MDTVIHRKKIGLLGGSFNPAHSGHVDISTMALEKLNLDAVWWIVTPKNPLKNADNIAPIDVRIIYAKNIVGNLPIIPMDIETDLGSTYTVNTLSHLVKQHREIDFIWLMGADNFATFDQWYKWEKIPNIMPLAIFNRPSYDYNALQGKASCAMKTFRTDNIADVFDGTLPKWIYIDDTNNTQSSTEIRKKCDDDWW